MYFSPRINSCPYFSVSFPKVFSSVAASKESTLGTSIVQLITASLEKNARWSKDILLLLLLLCYLQQRACDVNEVVA